MSSLNNLVLATFASNDIFNNQIDSLRRRYQTLAVIYMTIFLIILSISFPFIMVLLIKNPSAYNLTYYILPLLLLNLYIIRKKYLDTSAFILVLVLHITNVVASDLLNWPLVSIVGVMVYPYFLLFLTSSTKLILFNSALCFRQFFYNATKAYQLFEMTLTDDQYNQIVLFNSTSLYVLACISVIAIVQKTLEMSLWTLARENHQKSENLTKEVITALQAKDRFISMISHEIRNPLNALKGSVDYLLQVVKDAEHQKILRTAKLSGEILLNLVNNILDAAKLKSEKMEVSYMETNLVDIIKKVLKVNTELLKDKELSVQAYIDEDLPRDLWIDPSRVMQILMNLMSNAIKFTPKNEHIKISVEWCYSEKENCASEDFLLKPIEIYRATGESRSPLRIMRTGNSISQGMESPGDFLEMTFIEKEKFDKNMGLVSKTRVSSDEDASINTSQFSSSDPWKIYRAPMTNKSKGNASNNLNGGGGYLRVQVSDTGSGISEEDTKRLFGMFEQATQHSRSVHGGSGLGLWICKQLCQKMNGDITVYSELGKGSSFVFYLPAKREEAGVKNNGQNLREVDVKKMRALVVDDFASNRYLYKLLLEQDGVQVVTAGNGQEALEKYKAQSEEEGYTFILMDVDMPVKDGFTAAKEIREWEMQNKKKQVEIYFVTGEYFNEADVRRRFKNMGGESNAGIRYLRKPLDGDTFKKLLGNYNTGSSGNFGSLN